MKAEQGAHDQNTVYHQILISTCSGLDYLIILVYLFAFADLSAKDLISESLYNQISATDIALFKEASLCALFWGLILADTNFKCGLISFTDPNLPIQLILIDEV